MKKLLLFYVLTLISYFSFAQTIPTVILVDSIPGLSSPMKVTHAGDNSHRLFVVEKGGSIKVFDKNKNSLGTFITISGLLTSGEQGLLSMTFHPNFRNNGYFYVYFVNSSGNLAVDRYSVASPFNGNTVDVSTKLNIITILHPTNTNHNGGDIRFGRDGYLYISTGDGGSGGDPAENAQNINNKLGKLLRLDVDNGSPYINPSGNIINEIYCLGLRNPFRWNFDRHNGDFYLGDVGQSAREEIDFVPVGQLAGKNFGWDCREGNVAYTGDASLVDCSQTFTPPVHFYTINSTEKSIVGGAVYRGYKYPDLKGWYLAVDYYSSILRKFDRRTATASWTLNPQSNFPARNITSFSESEDGELYITTNNGSGKVYQLGTSTNAKTVHVFSGNGNWSDAANWKNGLPTGLNSNSVVVIKPLNGGTCTLDIDANLPLSSQLITEPGSKLIVNNNRKLWLKAN